MNAAQKIEKDVLEEIKVATKWVESGDPDFKPTRRVYQRMYGGTWGRAIDRLAARGQVEYDYSNDTYVIVKKVDGMEVIPDGDILVKRHYNGVCFARVFPKGMKSHMIHKMIREGRFVGHNPFYEWDETHNQFMPTTTIRFFTR